MSAEDDRSIRSADIENDSVTIGAASSVTFNVGTGTDTATNRYLNLSTNTTYGFEVIPYTNAVTITKINGKTLKAAITVGTGGYRTNNLKVSSVTVTAGTSTTVEVSMKG